MHWSSGKLISVPVPDRCCGCVGVEKASTLIAVFTLVCACVGVASLSRNLATQQHLMASQIVSKGGVSSIDTDRLSSAIAYVRWGSIGLLLVGVACLFSSLGLIWAIKQKVVLYVVPWMVSHVVYSLYNLTLTFFAALKLVQWDVRYHQLYIGCMMLWDMGMLLLLYFVLVVYSYYQQMSTNNNNNNNNTNNLDINHTIGSDHVTAPIIHRVDESHQCPSEQDMPINVPPPLESPLDQPRRSPPPPHPFNSSPWTSPPPPMPAHVVDGFDPPPIRAPPYSRCVVGSDGNPDLSPIAPPPYSAAVMCDNFVPPPSLSSPSSALPGGHTLTLGRKGATPSYYHALHSSNNSTMCTLPRRASHSDRHSILASMASSLGPQLNNNNQNNYYNVRCSNRRDRDSNTNTARVRFPQNDSRKGHHSNHAALMTSYFLGSPFNPRSQMNPLLSRPSAVDKHGRNSTRSGRNGRQYKYP